MPLYNSFLFDVTTGNIDLNTDTFYAMLVTSAYTFNQDTHTRRSDITNEVVGTGYTAGGQALTGVTVTQDNTGNRVWFDCNDPSWPSATITARGMVVYKRRGGLASADELVGFYDFVTDQSSSGAAFTVLVKASGLFQIAN